MQLEQLFVYNEIEEGTSVLNTIKKSMQYNQSLNMIYMDDGGTITKGRIKPFKVSGDTFVAYCFLRGSRRTFKIDGVLALVPVTKRKGVAI